MKYVTMYVENDRPKCLGVYDSKEKAVEEVAVGFGSDYSTDELDTETTRVRKGDQSYYIEAIKG